MIDHLGVDVLEHCTVLDTTASSYYDFATLRRSKFLYFRSSRDDPHFVAPNGKFIALPTEPPTIFDIGLHDVVHILYMPTLHYTLNNAAEFYAAVAEGGEGDDGDGDGSDEQQAQPETQEA